MTSLIIKLLLGGGAIAIAFGVGYLAGARVEIQRCEELKANIRIEAERQVIKNEALTQKRATAVAETQKDFNAGIVRDSERYRRLRESAATYQRSLSAAAGHPTGVIIRPTDDEFIARYTGLVTRCTQLAEDCTKTTRQTLSLREIAKTCHATE